MSSADVPGFASIKRSNSAPLVVLIKSKTASRLSTTLFANLTSPVDLLSTSSSMYASSTFILLIMLLLSFLSVDSNRVA